MTTGRTLCNNSTRRRPSRHQRRKTGRASTRPSKGRPTPYPTIPIERASITSSPRLSTSYDPLSPTKNRFNHGAQSADHQLRRHLHHHLWTSTLASPLAPERNHIFVQLEQTRAALAAPQQEAHRELLSLQLLPHAPDPSLQCLKLLYRIPATPDPQIQAAVGEFGTAAPPTQSSTRTSRALFHIDVGPSTPQPNDWWTASARLSTARTPPNTHPNTGEGARVVARALAATDAVRPSTTFTHSANASRAGPGF